MSRGKTPKMELLEVTDQGKRSIQEILQDAYVEGGGKQVAAAEIVGISPSLFGLWVMRLNVQLPKVKQSA